MIDLKNMSRCENRHLYPNRFDKCPHCHVDAKSRKPAPLTPEQINAANAISLARGDIDEWQISGAK